jgi:peroxiredoxin Q/BCP
MLELLGIGRYKPVKGAQPGDKAPDFSLRDQEGREVSLSGLIGEQPVVLAFFPRANSPL